MKKYYYKYKIGNQGYNIYSATELKSNWTLKTETVCLYCCFNKKNNGRIEKLKTVLITIPLNCISKYKRINEKEAEELMFLGGI